MDVHDCFEEQRDIRERLAKICQSGADYSEFCDKVGLLVAHMGHHFARSVLIRQVIGEDGCSTPQDAIRWVCAYLFEGVDVKFASYNQNQDVVHVEFDAALEEDAE